MQVALFLGGVEVPYHVIGQAVHTEPCNLCHFGQSFGFDLMVHGFYGEVNALPMSVVFRKVFGSMEGRSMSRVTFTMNICSNE